MFKITWNRNPLKDWTYRVGVKRRWLPGYRKFNVVKHTHGDEGETFLTLAKGGRVHVPGGAELRLYPEYDAVMGRHRALKEEQEAQALEAAAQREKIVAETLQEQAIAREVARQQQPAPGPTLPGPVNGVTFGRNDLQEKAAAAARARIAQLNPAAMR